MHERRFNREIERLRDPERLARLEVERVVALSLEGLEGVKKILDIGTGSGVFAEIFAAKGLEVNGVDANPDVLPVAQDTRLRQVAGAQGPQDPVAVTGQIPRRKGGVQQ